MSQPTTLHCKQTGIEFVKTQVEGTNFCYVEITELCSPVADGGVKTFHNSTERRRYEPCAGYLLPATANSEGKK